MADDPNGRHQGEEAQEEQPARLPRSVAEKPEEEDDSVDASFRVIEDRLSRLLIRQVAVVREEIRSELHIGPLPHQETLEAYNRIVPGSAEMIFRNFDEQGQHRRQMESYALRWGNYRSFAGLACALVVAMSFLVVSYLLIKGGHGWEGTVLATVDVVGLVSAFIYGTRSLKAEREEKTKIMAGREEKELPAQTE